MPQDRLRADLEVQAVRGVGAVDVVEVRALGIAQRILVRGRQIETQVVGRIHEVRGTRHHPERRQRPGVKCEDEGHAEQYG